MGECFTPTRIVWMTYQQRKEVWNVLTIEIKENENCEHSALFINILKQIELVQKQERVSGRLVEGYATGLMLPHDALPIRVTDYEAEILLTLPITNKAVRRMLQPGILKQGHR